MDGCKDDLEDNDDDGDGYEDDLDPQVIFQHQTMIWTAVRILLT